MPIQYNWLHAWDDQARHTRRCKWNLIKTEVKDTGTKYQLQDKERGLIKQQPCGHDLVMPASTTVGEYPCLELSILLSEPTLPSVPEQAYLSSVSTEVSVIHHNTGKACSTFTAGQHDTNFIGKHLSFIAIGTLSLFHGRIVFGL